MVKLIEGKWYLSKRGYLCRLDNIKAEEVIVTAHYSGNRVIIPMEQAKQFTHTDQPTTPPGTAVLGNMNIDEKDYTDMYSKYPNIVPGSIYTVKSTNTPSEQIIKVNGKIRMKKDKTPSGATRCTVQCQTPGCKNTRDIKVQDAFQVKYCVECKKTKQKEKLKNFLKNGEK